MARRNTLNGPVYGGVSGGAALSLLMKTNSAAARSGGNAVGRGVFLWRTGLGGCRASACIFSRNSSSGGSAAAVSADEKHDFNL